MSIDVAFQPKGPTVLVGTTPIQVVPVGTGPGGFLSFRIANNVLASPAATRVGWGTASGQTASTAPGASPAFSVNIAAGAVITLELPSTTWFVASAAASLEITPGQGATSA